MPDRDVALAVALEPGNEGRHRIVQAHAALLDQLHHRRRRRDDLGQRGEVEDRVERHRLGRRHDRALAVRLFEDDRVAAPDEHDRARRLFPPRWRPTTGLDRCQRIAMRVADVHVRQPFGALNDAAKRQRDAARRGKPWQTDAAIS